MKKQTVLPIDNSPASTPRDGAVNMMPLTRAEERFDAALSNQSTVKYSAPFDDEYSYEIESSCAKRPNADDLESADATPLKKMRTQDDRPLEQLRTVQPSEGTISKNIQGSAAFSRTLQMLVSGKTIDTRVGGTSLSKILDGVPGLLPEDK